MSTSTAALFTRFLQFNIQFSSIALVYYDYALTLPMEIQYIWCQKFRLSTLLYIWCRYALVGNILYLLAIADMLQQSCDTWYKVIAGLSVLGRIAVIFSMSAKTFAIFGRNRFILAYFVVIGTVCVVSDIVHVPGRRCKGSGESGQDRIAGPLNAISMVMIEYSAAVLVFFRSFQAHRVCGTRQFEKKNKALLQLILEHGVLYFVFVTLLTTVSVILYFTTSESNWFMKHLFNALTLPLSCLFTARFLLHLRAWEYKRTSGSWYSPGNEQRFNTPRPSARTTSRLTILSLDDFGEDPLQETVLGDDEDEQEEVEGRLHESTSTV